MKKIGEINILPGYTQERFKALAKTIKKEELTELEEKFGTGIHKEMNDLVQSENGEVYKIIVYDYDEELHTLLRGTSTVVEVIVSMQVDRRKMPGTGLHKKIIKECK